MSKRKLAAKSNGHATAPPEDIRQVWWCVLMERSIQEKAVDALLNLAMHAGGNRFTRICVPYQRTDMARNRCVATFREQAKRPDDTLVMLDADHAHSPDTLERLARHNVGVVGALAFRRREPYDPCFFVKRPDGEGYAQKAEWPRGLVQCDIVGTGAVAIQRWVFDRLAEAGYGPHFFQYEYGTGGEVFSPSEDMFFGLACGRCGIPHHVDTTLVTPHLHTFQIDEGTWQQSVAQMKAAQSPQLVEA